MLLIRSVQVELNNMGAVIKALPHLARPSDRTAKEVLSFVCIMLFNANEEIQVSDSRIERERRERERERERVYLLEKHTQHNKTVKIVHHAGHL